MNNQKPCEYNHPQCQKTATINHYLPNTNLTQDRGTCANCGKSFVSKKFN